MPRRGTSVGREHPLKGPGSGCNFTDVGLNPDAAAECGWKILAAPSGARLRIKDVDREEGDSFANPQFANVALLFNSCLVIFCQIPDLSNRHTPILNGLNFCQMNF